MRQKHILIALFIFFFNSFLFSQVNKENLKYGHEAFDNGDYYSASYYFAKAIELEPENIEFAYWLADASRLSYAYKDAEKWYLFVKEKKSNNTYPLLYLHLGSVSKSLGKYKEALNFYNQFVNDNAVSKTPELLKAKQEVASCIKAIEIMKDTLKVSINRLENTINTPYTEFNGFPLGDSVLYFSSLRPTSKEMPNPLIPSSYNTMIYKSNLSLSGWSEAKVVDSKINTNDAHNANITFNPERNTIYFSRCYENKTSKMNCSLYKSKYENNKWTTPEKLPDKINVPGYTSTQPSYGRYDNAQDVLFFVSDKPGGQGGLDIWYSVIKDDNFNEPINLGSFVNTPGDEISPYYHIPTKTLYFSSDWIEGLGGYDIFKTKGFFNEWTKPENVGYPINTSYNDMYFVLNDNYPEGYLTSNRPGSLHLKGETCCNDIYYVKFNEVKKEVKKDTTSIIAKLKDTLHVTIKTKIDELLPLTLYFHNDEPDPATTKTTTENSYETTLSNYIKLKDIYVKEYSEGLTGENKLKAQSDILEFFDNYVQNGFEKLKKFTAWLSEDLAKGNTVQITIRGYCSPLNTSQYNINLSKRRISSLINYIKTYDNGTLLKYINGTAENKGKIEIYEEPLGDMEASSFVSKNPNDLKNSVYSRVAALERKVEIVMYNSGHDSSDFKFPEVTFRNPNHDFGNIKKGDKATYIFIFKNTGKSPLLITSVESTSSAIVTDWQAKEIIPDGTGVINILFDSKNLSGDIKENIYVTANTNQGKILLEIKAFVEE